MVVGPKGIFVPETTNYAGWIFENENRQNWTQVIYKRKEKFYNTYLAKFRPYSSIKRVLRLKYNSGHPLFIHCRFPKIRACPPIFYSVKVLGDMPPEFENNLKPLNIVHINEENLIDHVQLNFHGHFFLEMKYT